MTVFFPHTSPEGVGHHRGTPFVPSELRGEGGRLWIKIMCTALKIWSDDFVYCYSFVS